MSTSEVFLSEQEASNFIKEFYKDFNYIYGYKDQEFGICPYITFYIYHKDGEVKEILNKISDLYAEFEMSIIDKPFKLRFKCDTEVWKKADNWVKNSNEMLIEMEQVFKKYLVYFLGATTADADMQSARWALEGNIRISTNSLLPLKAKKAL
jgi:hypothetical protein